MKLIKKITDEDFGLKSISFNNPRIRYSARGIVLNSQNKIAILNKTVKNEYKLVGGGMEMGEAPSSAFKREVFEETGCKIVITNQLGIIEEDKSLDNFKQISYVFVAKVIDDTGNLHLTKKEVEEGSKLLWLNIDEALNRIKNSENKLIASKYENLYHSKFIVRRDYEILNYYLKFVKNKIV